jgi:hypothetical protein
MAVTPEQRRQMLYIVISSILFLLMAIIIELTVGNGTYRHLLIVVTGLVLVIIIAALVLGQLHEPTAWKHVFKPVRYDTEWVTYIRTFMDKDVLPGTWLGYQERLKICLWLREAVAEALELNWKGTVPDFNSMLLRPEVHHYLSDKPALKKMLTDLLDVGVYKDKSMLYLRRKDFLTMVDKIFKEVGGP